MVLIKDDRPVNRTNRFKADKINLEVSIWSSNFTGITYPLELKEDIPPSKDTVGKVNVILAASIVLNMFLFFNAIYRAAYDVAFSKIYSKGWL